MSSSLSKRGYDLRIDFEKYKDNYSQEIQKSISFIGRKHSFFVEEKVKKLLELTRQHLGDPSRLKILDVGCGVGITDHYLTRHFRKLYGIDLSKGVVQKAANLNPKALYRYYAGKTLPYPSHSMDVTFAICVMHHVLPQGLKRFAEEMIRVTKKGGLIFVFEHNPFNLLTQVAVSRCELDKDAVLLKMGKVEGLLKRKPVRIIDKRYIFFTPFGGPFFSIFDRCLGWLPLGAQYYIAAQK